MMMKTEMKKIGVNEGTMAGFDVFFVLSAVVVVVVVVLKREVKKMVKPE